MARSRRSFATPSVVGRRADPPPARDELDPAEPILGRLPVAVVEQGGAGQGPALVAGTVRRLVFAPDGAEGRLIATLDDGTGELEAVLPRRHAGDWAPGEIVAAEGSMQGRGFVVRAYLSLSRSLSGADHAAAAAWTEVSPLRVLTA
jgi:hypothetical protein